jgi:hypothetical protein
MTRGRRTQAGLPRGRAQGGAGRFARHPTPSRTFGMRRKPQQSALQKAMGTLLPMAAAKKAAPSSKKGKAGGAALLAAAAAGAGALMRKRQSRGDATTQPPPASTM